MKQNETDTYDESFRAIAVEDGGAEAVDPFLAANFLIHVPVEDALGHVLAPHFRFDQSAVVPLGVNLAVILAIFLAASVLHQDVGIKDRTSS